MRTITGDDFKSQYGEEAVSEFSVVPQEKNYGERLGANLSEDLNTRIERTNQILGRQDTGLVEKGTQMFGQGLGLAANAAEQTVFQLPVIKQAVEGFGKGVDWLSKTSPIKAIGDVIGGGKTFQEVVQLYDNDPNFRDTVDAFGNVVRAYADASTIQSGVKGAVKTSKNVIAKVENELASVVQDMNKSGALPKIKGAVGTPETIMQRVARIPKGEQAKFQKVSGQSVGEYLTKRGIYGNTDKITTQLYERFAKSMNTADDAFNKLNGEFSPAPVKTALQDLLAREMRVSSVGAESPNLSRVQQLLKKIDGQGLTMKEINEAKRLFERNVKMDYLKSAAANPEGVVKATNLDSAIRNWQFEQAKTLGLKNLDAINNETRFAKQLLDALGKENAGAAGNNAVTLTDWIMLSGGDPTAIGGFLSKKALSSKTIQSAIAKWLNRNKPVMGDVKADIGTSQVKQLPAGTGGAKVQGTQPIKLLGPSTMEKGVPKRNLTNPTVGETVKVTKWSGGEKGKKWAEIKNISGNQGSASFGKTKGISVATDDTSSSMFGSNKATGELKNAKLYDLTKVGDWTNSYKDPNYKVWFKLTDAGAKGEDFISYMAKKGYDGVKYLADDGSSIWIDLKEGLNPFK